MLRKQKTNIHIKCLDNSGMTSDVVANEYDGSLYSYFAFPTGKGTSPGRISSYVKVTQFSKDLSPEKFEAAMKFWDYYYSAESLKIHQSIEQPTAMKGAALSEAMALAEGLLETIDRAGSYTTTDLNIPSEVMDAIHANEEAVLLGEMKPDQATENIQAAVKVYKEANQ